jgi:hypothetical protein
MLGAVTASSTQQDGWRTLGKFRIAEAQLRAFIGRGEGLFLFLFFSFMD